jgi:hypothetical protein
VRLKSAADLPDKNINHFHCVFCTLRTTFRTRPPFYNKADSLKPALSSEKLHHLLLKTRIQVFPYFRVGCYVGQ